MTFTPGHDTLAFGTVAVFIFSCLIVNAWHRRDDE